MTVVRSREEVAQFSARDAFAFYDAETVWVVWDTSQACIERLQPPLFKPAQKPLAVAAQAVPSLTTKA